MKAKSCAALALAAAMVLGGSNVFAAGGSRYFTDVNDNSYGWAGTAVDYLYEKNIASGVGSGKYSPESEIKRCDFIILVNKAFNLTPFNDMVANFNDINKDDYFYDAVVNAKGAGIIKTDYAFYPRQPIIRGDAMQMLYTALDKGGYISAASTDLSMYTDEAEVKDINSRLALGTLTQMGIISGDNGKIKYAETMSRAEMAMIFYKALNYMENNKPSEKPVVTEKPEVQKPEQPAEDTESKENKGNVLSEQELKETVVIDGNEITGIDNAKVRLSGSSVNSVEVAADVKTEINNALIQAMGVGSNGVFIDRDSSVEMENTQLTAGNNDTSGVKGGDSTKVVITGGKVIVDGNRATGVKTTGKADISETEFNVSKGSAVTAEVDGEITVENAVLNGSDVVNGLFYATTEKGEDKGRTEINVKNCEITGDRKTTLFYADNSDLKATLENCDVKQVSKLVDCGSTSGAKGSGSNDITIDLINQELTADVECDEISRLTINLKNGSHLIAAVNSRDSADYIEINVEKGSVLELVENSYIHVLKYDDIYDIHEQGRVIYYDEDDPENRFMQFDDYPLANGGYMAPMEK